MRYLIMLARTLDVTLAAICVAIDVPHHVSPLPYVCRISHSLHQNLCSWVPASMRRNETRWAPVRYHPQVMHKWRTCWVHLRMDGSCLHSRADTISPHLRSVSLLACLSCWATRVRRHQGTSSPPTGTFHSILLFCFFHSFMPFLMEKDLCWADEKQVSHLLKHMCYTFYFILLSISH